MPNAYINIGSNQGHRQANIGRAVALIADLPGVDSWKVSAMMESEPWGFDSSHRFMNAGMAVSTSYGAEELLGLLLEIEKSISPDAHRNPDGSYRDRVVDIDLIAVDDEVMDTPHLTLPHPRMHLREFVILPMMELAPDWHHPLLGLTPGEMLRSLHELHEG